MPKPGDLIVVHLVEDRALGAQFERARLQWPLHITLAPWFSVSDQTRVTTALSEAAAALKPFDALVGEDRAFGAQGEIPVNVIENQADILPLHQAIIAKIREAGGEFENTRFIDPHYTAHITHHAGTRRQQGDIERVDDFHLVRLLPPNTCEVVGRFVLGDGQ